jgi:hypothetical protein
MFNQEMYEYFAMPIHHAVFARYAPSYGRHSALRPVSPVKPLYRATQAASVALLK